MVEIDRMGNLSDEKALNQQYGGLNMGSKRDKIIKYISKVPL
jgi:hypothetical protein